jgi:hypothetical protein
MCGSFRSLFPVEKALLFYMHGLPRLGPGIGLGFGLLDTPKLQVGSDLEALALKSVHHYQMKDRRR